MTERHQMFEKLVLCDGRIRNNGFKAEQDTVFYWIYIFNVCVFLEKIISLQIVAPYQIFLKHKMKNYAIKHYRTHPKMFWDTSKGNI